ncbi:MAG TPA: hypothetical protein VN033_10320 [Vulgatibacter sp.]|nr:hypothetical protein [Vulgatibacter sp.]
MCEPTTAALIMMGVGAGVQAYGQHQQGQEAARAAEANRRFSLIAAGDAVQRGQLEAGRARLAGSQVIGEQRAAFGASGIDPSTGSAAALAADTRAASELDAAIIANNAAREAWGYRNQADELARQAAGARRAGNMAAAGSLLGGLGSVGLGAYGAGMFGGTAAPGASGAAMAGTTTGVSSQQWRNWMSYRGKGW